MNEPKKFPHPPGSKEWDAEAYNLVISFAPPVRVCKKCGAPNMTGYCCGYCGDHNPSETFAEEAQNRA